MWISFCCSVAVFPWSCIEPCQASGLFTWLFEKKKKRKERKRKRSGRGIRWQHQGQILKEGAETTAMTHQCQEEVAGVQFDFYSQRIAAIWLVNYSLAWWRKPLQAYQGKDLPQIRDLFFLMQVCEFATEVEIWKSSVRPKNVFYFSNTWITAKVSTGSHELQGAQEVEALNM